MDVYVRRIHKKRGVHLQGIGWHQAAAYIVCRKKLLNKVSSATDFDNCTEDISILHWTTLGLIG